MVLTSKPVVFQCGSLLHAQLEIWKVACVQGAAIDLGSLETSTQSSSSCGDASEGTVLFTHYITLPAYFVFPANYCVIKNN